MTSLTELTLSDNSFRLREFHTRAVLIEEAGKKTVRKIAATEKAGTFLKAITMREKANSLNSLTQSAVVGIYLHRCLQIGSDYTIQ